MSPPANPLRQDLIRSVAEECGAVRAMPIGKRFTMWPLSELGSTAQAVSLDAATLDEAEQKATPGPMPLDLARGGFSSFVILEEDDRARETRRVVHFYTVKVSRCWRNVGMPAVTKKVAVPYAVRQGSLPVNDFDPRRPFDALADCPVTGRQPGEQPMIEVQP